MSSNTKVYEDKMKSSVEHLSRELAAVRAGRANPAVLDKVVVDYYGAPTPIQQLADCPSRSRSSIAPSTKNAFCSSPSAVSRRTRSLSISVTLSR